MDGVPKNTTKHKNDFFNEKCIDHGDAKKFLKFGKSKLFPRKLEQ
jgi:hypothetical protein